MTDRNQIQEIVFRAIDRVNEVLLNENVLAKDSDLMLLGDGGALDSMGFVNFIVALEDELAENAGLGINLAEELNATAGGAAKPATVGELIAFLCVLAKAKSDAGKES